MKHLFLQSLGLFALSATLTLQAATPSSGLVDFGKFTPPESGRQFVEVNINSNLIGIAARLTQRAEPEVAELLQGIQRIRVNVMSLDEANRTEVENRVKTIREDLDKQGWERIVTVQQKTEDVGIHLRTRGQEAVEGLVVTVLKGNKEAVLVNIVGNIVPEKLAILGERFNIDPLKQMGPGFAKKKSSQSSKSHEGEDCDGNL
jgi:hypothetical protein